MCDARRLHDAEGEVDARCGDAEPLGQRVVPVLVGGREHGQEAAVAEAELHVRLPRVLALATLGVGVAKDKVPLRPKRDAGDGCPLVQVSLVVPVELGNPPRVRRGRAAPPAPLARTPM